MQAYILNDDRDDKDILIEIRESTGMNRKQFCELFEIPYMTVSDWEHGKKRVPKYFLRLLMYYVRMEQIRKEKRDETDAVKNYLIPVCNYREDLQWLPYAEEADLLNVALFGFTAKAWREANPELAKNSNVRDYATINELTVLSNLESHNAQMIREGMDK